MSNVVSAANRLAFTGKHKVQCSHNPNPIKKTNTQLSAAGAVTKVFVVKSSTKTMQNEKRYKNEVAKETK
jgi:hypothetical protein